MCWYVSFSPLWEEGLVKVVVVVVVWVLLVE